MKIFYALFGVASLYLAVSTFLMPDRLVDPQNQSVPSLKREKAPSVATPSAREAVDQSPVDPTQRDVILNSESANTREQLLE